MRHYPVAAIIQALSVYSETLLPLSLTIPAVVKLHEQEKYNSIVEKHYKTESELEHMQKTLNSDVGILENKLHNIQLSHEVIQKENKGLRSIEEKMRMEKIHAESEKERFVTYYFNGLRDKPFPLEERLIVPSATVSTYDQRPEMSSQKITDTIIAKLATLDYKLAVVNYPNSDMVGHTGNIGPTVKAVEIVDTCVGKLANFVIAYDGAMLITSDHGNAEEMINATTGEIDTEHSSNPVPIILIGKPYLGKPQILRTGILADVAPTVLGLLNIVPPASMTGRDLLKEVRI